jgi:hypothetical protein
MPIMKGVFRSLPSKGPIKRAAPPPLCGCGLSLTFPLCDSSQMISRTHEPGQLASCGAGKRVVAKAEALEV